MASLGYTGTFSWNILASAAVSNSKLKCFLSRLAFVFAKPIEAWF